MRSSRSTSLIGVHHLFALRSGRETSGSNAASSSDSAVVGFELGPPLLGQPDLANPSVIGLACRSSIMSCASSERSSRLDVAGVEAESSPQCAHIRAVARQSRPRRSAEPRRAACRETGNCPGARQCAA